MRIDKWQAIDDAWAGVQGMARFSCFAKNRQPGPRACGVASPGEESFAAAVAAKQSRLAVVWPDHVTKRPRGSCAKQAVKQKEAADWAMRRLVVRVHHFERI
jgi:hypothetical protein